MFFPDVLAGVREMLRVTKPGGYVSFVVWAAREVNPFFSVVTETLDRFVPAEAEDEDAPAAFRFAAAGKLAKLLQEAGATSVTERTLAFTIEAPITVEQFWELRTEMSDTFRKKLARLVPDQVAAIRYTVQKAVASYFKTGGMSFPARVLVVTGKKPSTACVSGQLPRSDRNHRPVGALQIYGINSPESSIGFVSASSRGTKARYIASPRNQLSLCQRRPRASHSVAGTVDSGLCLKSMSSGMK